MDAPTMAALRRLTRSFYDHSAIGFAARSERPWPGWVEALDRLRGRLTESPRPAILDVGCGNARLALLLARKLEPPFTYVGLDVSLPLIAGVARRIPWARLVVSDLLDGAPEQVLPRGRFDLVALFGVLHHMPGFANRRALLEALAGRVKAGGALALSTWRKPPAERFERRQADPSIDPARLEPGDHLITRPGHGSRYCHFADRNECRRLFAGLPLRLAAAYTADGPRRSLNRYYLLCADRDGVASAYTPQGAGQALQPQTDMP